MAKAHESKKKNTNIACPNDETLKRSSLVIYDLALPFSVQNLEKALPQALASSLQKVMKLKKSQVEALELFFTDTHHYEILRRSTDARERNDILFRYKLEIPMDAVLKHFPWFSKPNMIQALLMKPQHFGLVERNLDVPFWNQCREKRKERILVVGAGPAGLFASYCLVQAGFNVVVLERGEAIPQRIKTVELFELQAILNPESNIQFGEGGAGTFSDGKLTTRIKDTRAGFVLETLVKYGAPKEILYLAKPHIGTDLLRNVILNFRQDLEKAGVEFHFSSTVKNLLMTPERRVYGVCTQTGIIEADAVILATGHSSRSLYESLYQQGVSLEAKPFAVGLRIEHAQNFIDRSRYGSFAGHSRLGAAEYALTASVPLPNKFSSEKAKVYSFCMCPGGKVINASSEQGHLCVNGMSEHARACYAANSAILVGVSPNHFGNHPLAGIAFQKRLESKAFRLTSSQGESTWKLPTQPLQSFLNAVSKIDIDTLKGEPEDFWKAFLYSDLEFFDPVDFSVLNNEFLDFQEASPDFDYQNTQAADLRQVFPIPLLFALAQGIQSLDKKLKGFSTEKALLKAVESRSSAPLRILREKETLQSVNTPRLFPCGEGAGYAGGITSSAVDGIKIAEAIVSLF